MTATQQGSGTILTSLFCTPESKQNPATHHLLQHAKVPSRLHLPLTLTW